MSGRPRKNLSVYQRSSIEQRRKLALALNSAESLEELRPAVIQLYRDVLESEDSTQKEKMEAARSLLPYMFSTKRENVNIGVRLEDLMADIGDDVEFKVIKEEENDGTTKT